MTSATKLDYGMRKKNTFGYEYVAVRKDNYPGQETSRYHTDHTRESYFVGVFCDAG